MEIVALRFLHIVGGILWVGGAVFQMVFIAPALRRAGPDAAPVMAALREGGSFTFLPLVALATILSGVRLMAIMSGGFDARWFNSPSGSMYAWSGLIAIVAFVLGLTTARPLANRLGRLGAELGSTTEESARTTLTTRIATAQRWMAIVGATLTILLLLAATGMAVARYQF